MERNCRGDRRRLRGTGGGRLPRPLDRSRLHRRSHARGEQPGDPPRVRASRRPAGHGSRDPRPARDRQRARRGRNPVHPRQSAGPAAAGLRDDLVLRASHEHGDGRRGARRGRPPPTARRRGRPGLGRGDELPRCRTRRSRRAGQAHGGARSGRRHRWPCSWPEGPGPQCLRGRWAGKRSRVHDPGGGERETAPGHANHDS